MACLIWIQVGVPSLDACARHEPSLTNTMFKYRTVKTHYAQPDVKFGPVLVLCMGCERIASHIAMIKKWRMRCCTICAHPVGLQQEADDWLSSNRPTSKLLLYILDSQVSAVTWSATRKQLDRPGKTKRALRVNWIWLNAWISGRVKQVVEE